LKVETEEG